MVDRLPPGSSPDSTEPATRASDEDRYQVVEVLRRHTSDGRLTLDEFSDRVGAAFAAKSHMELALVTSDLPAIGEAVPASATVARRRPTRRVIAVMTENHRRGRWRAGSKLHAFAFMGAVKLDLRQAEIEGDELVITAIAFMGGVDIVVPEGIDVDLTGLPIMGGKQMHLADVPVVAGSPLIRIRAFPFMGGVDVHTKRDRRGKRRKELTDQSP